MPEIVPVWLKNQVCLCVCVCVWGGGGAYTWSHISVKEKADLSTGGGGLCTDNYGNLENFSTFSQSNGSS